MNDYFCLIQSLIAYIETRVKNPPEAEDFQRDMALSWDHLRAVFRDHLRLPLGRYMTERRIANTAFELVHSQKSALDIALEYGFGNPDTFTRAFRRVSGLTPSAFRRAHIPVGRVRLTGGVFGPGILGGNVVPQRSFSSEEIMKKKNTIERTDDSCVLYGVRKVEYCYEEATPFPACLRSVLNYLGQEIDYCYLMAASGASFRLRWNPAFWDGGNVDIMNIHEDPKESFIRAFKAAGRSWRFLEPSDSTKKEDFISFIKSEIDEGRPLIALGIIGPPEACIVSGYRNGGTTLLGWNFFQDNPEFAGGSGKDASGYFTTDRWWENRETVMLMAVGEERQAQGSLREMVEHAVWILETEKVGPWAGAQAAWKLWLDKLADESEWGEGLPLPKLFERLMCQNDALTMISEGRAYAHYFLKWAEGSLKEQGKAEAAKLASEAAGLFNRIFEAGQSVWKMQGGMNSEASARTLARPEVRAKMLPLLREAAKLETEAGGMLNKLLALL